MGCETGGKRRAGHREQRWQQRPQQVRGGFEERERKRKKGISLPSSATANGREKKKKKESRVEAPSFSLFSRVFSPARRLCCNLSPLRKKVLDPLYASRA